MTTGSNTKNNYYAFGMAMPGRSYQSSNGYRYGFNGKENDLESGTQDYGMRIYNPVVGRFFSVDPITDEYPELTPFQFASNKPISSDDIDGLEENDRTTYVHKPNPKLIQANIEMIKKQAITQSSSFKLGSGGVMKWAGYVLVKTDATRVEYQRRVDPLKGKKDLATSQKRANLKAEFRPKTPQPFRALLDKQRPMNSEQAKVKEGGNAGKTNATVDAMNNVFNAAGKGLIVYSALNSAKEIYNSDDPLRQTAIEGGGWGGAIAGGTIGAELGAPGGPYTSLVVGIVMSFYGCVAGEEGVREITAPKDNSPLGRVKEKILTEQVGSESFESKKEVK